MEARKPAMGAMVWVRDAGGSHLNGNRVRIYFSKYGFLWRWGGGDQLAVALDGRLQEKEVARMSPGFGLERMV